MRFVIQRVNNAKVTVDGNVTGSIGKGLLIFFGAGQNDTEEMLQKFKEKIVKLRIFADKDVEHMVKVITPKAKKVFTVTPNSMRAETAEELMNEVKKYNESCEAYNDYKNAFEDALKLCKKDDLLLISGSLYMIGEMRGIIKKIL